MSEFGIRPPQHLAETIRMSENEREEAWRERYLSDNLFHPDHTKAVWEKSPENSAVLLALEQEFLHEKKGKNMGERFALALDDRYLGKIHTIELGSTTNPAANGAVDGLKEEYHDLLNWLKQNSIVEDEMSRQESGRTIELRTPVDPEAAKNVIIMVRDRPLIKAELEHDGRYLDIDIKKRMVFALPLMTARLLLNRFIHKLPRSSSGDGIDERYVPKLFNDEEVLDFIESTFLLHGSGGVVPIRTSYLLATEVKPPAEHR